MRRLFGIVCLTLGCWLAPGAAAAGEAEGLKVGLASAGGEVAGLLVGGGLGLAWGAWHCETHSYEHYCVVPLVTTPLGGLVGGIGGAAAGGALRARTLDVDHRKVRAWTLAAAAGGLGVSVLGRAVDSNGLMAAGAIGGAVAMPIAAGAAATRSGTAVVENDDRFSVSISPTLGLQSYGVSLDGRF